MTEPANRATSPAPSSIALTRQVLNRAFWRYFWAFQISWNYERMQALGFAWAMVPVLRHLNRDDKKFTEALQRHLVFFNTSTIVGGPLILGTTIAMEEAGSPTSADGVKVAMMGPMAGIGDTITFALYNSIIFSIGAGWALQGQIIGPIFAAVMVLIPYYAVRRWQFGLGYKEGRNLAQRMSSGALEKFREGLVILGMIMIGGLVPYIVKMVITLTYSKTITANVSKPITEKVPIQTQLDTLLPYLLPVALTALVYFLLVRFRLSPLWGILIIFVIGLALGGPGWFAKALPGSGS